MPPKNKLPEYLNWLPNPDNKHLQIVEVLTEDCMRVLAETSPKYPEQAPPVAREMVRRYNLFKVYKYYISHCNSCIQIGTAPKPFEEFCQLAIPAERIKQTEELDKWSGRLTK